MLYRETFRKAVGPISIVTVVLIVIASYSSYEGYGYELWSFAVTTLVAWSVADFILLIFDVSPARNIIGFLIYAIGIMVSSALANGLTQELVGKNVNNLSFYLIIALSLIASGLAYLLASARLYEGSVELP